MKKKYLFKAMIRPFLGWVEMEYLAYHQNCEMNPEFCPPPNFNWCVDKLEIYLKKYGYTVMEFADWCESRCKWWRHPFGTPVEHIVISYIAQAIEQA